MIWFESNREDSFVSWFELNRKIKKTFELWIESNQIFWKSVESIPPKNESQHVWLRYFMNLVPLTASPLT